MNETIQAPSRTSKGSSSSAAGAAASGEARAPSKTEQITITRDVVTGDVLGIETTDPSGRRVAISEESLRGIAGEDEFEELEDALNEAFESGVTMLFDEADDENGNPDSLDRTAILRALAIALAGRRAARHFERTRQNLFRRLLLRRVVRRYFLRQRLAASLT
jgi:hypothetical protein